MQLQVYREWLPTVVGSNMVAQYSLNMSSSQSTYEPDVEPTVWNEFVTAAFRFGHSMIQNGFENRDYQRDERQPKLDVPMRDAFNAIPNYNNPESGFTAENFITGMYRQRGEIS